jgi:hypothetical protein
MLDKPGIEDEKIAACLRASYGLTVTELTFLPLGYDSAAGVYRVRAGQQDYFLKVRSEPASRLSVLLPHYLHAQGMAHLIAPILTGAGAPWGTVDRFTLILYPFINGANAWNTGLDRVRRGFESAACDAASARPASRHAARVVHSPSQVDGNYQVAARDDREPRL